MNDELWRLALQHGSLRQGSRTGTCPYSEPRVLDNVVLILEELSKGSAVCPY